MLSVLLLVIGVANARRRRIIGPTDISIDWHRRLRDRPRLRASAYHNDLLLEPGRGRLVLVRRLSLGWLLVPLGRWGLLRRRQLCLYGRRATGAAVHRHGPWHRDEECKGG